ncbi:MAG: DNA/RNA non-specific endonuclease, partial [Pyrinomonadaceae bacterium]
ALAAVGFVIFRVIRPFLRGNANQQRVQDDRRTNDPVSPGDTAALTEIHLRLGNPSAATPDAKNTVNLLLVNQAFALSYNRDRGAPNWVSWRVTPADLGELRRSDDFRPDNRLPNGWPQTLPTDYIRSGYTRGHMCPAGDRSADRASNSATFLMTNIVPQTDDSNQGVWQSMEVYSRMLVRRGATVYIIAGAYGEKGRIRNRVTIPTNIWKVVVVVPRGEEITDRLSPNTRVIAINTPNIDGVHDDDWRKYATTVRAIEQATGLDLLSRITREDQDRVETKVGTF